MVRHGNGIAEPGCISMTEALMLERAMNGGPSGPGTGTTPGLNGGNTGFGTGFNQGVNGRPSGPGNRGPAGFNPGFNGGPSGPGNRGPAGFNQGFNGGPSGPGNRGPAGFNQGFNGGPSGPGNRGPAGFNQGFNQPQQTPFVPLPQSPQQNFNNFQQQPPSQSIPGVNFLGGGVPERRGFEDRFQSLSGPGPLNQQRPGWQQAGGFDGGRPGSMNPGPVATPSFIDPQVGGAFGNRRFGVDGGRNIGNSHVGQNGGFNTNINQGNAFSGGGSRNQWNAGFQGETQSANVNIEQVGQGDGRVSTIMQDTDGYHYIFYHQSTPIEGVRVNITKEGLCTRFETSPLDNRVCSRACTTDDDCGGTHKCCPTGCTLGCMPPFLENDAPQPQQTSPARATGQPSVSGWDATCRPCNPATGCPGRLYCYYSPRCSFQICQPL